MLSARTLFVELYNQENPLVLECGESFSRVRVAYQAYGTLNAERDNVILICHALTGNSHAAGRQTEIENDPYNQYDFLNKYSVMSHGKAGWWDDVIGPGKAFDTDKYFVICPNILGSCYGTTGPSSINPATGESFNKSFPVVTVRDMVKLHYDLLTHLGIKRLKAAAGGSLGGMQVLELGIMYPDFVEYLFPMATAAKNPAWAIALNLPAREAIINDPDFNGGAYIRQPERGLEIARMIGMISYRSDVSYEMKFGRQIQPDGSHQNANGRNGNGRNGNGRNGNGRNDEFKRTFAIQSYLNYQGKKLVKRFDANTYLCVTQATDLHDVSRGRGTIEKALGCIKAKTISVGITSDVLYPVSEQKLIAEMTPAAEYAEVRSDLGHDAFLIEFPQIEKIVKMYI